MAAFLEDVHVVLRDAATIEWTIASSDNISMNMPELQGAACQGLNGKHTAPPRNQIPFYLSTKLWYCTESVGSAIRVDVDV